MSQKITYQKAKPSDWKIVQKLNHEVFKDNAKYDPFEDMNWPLTKHGINYFKKVTSSQKYYCQIAFDQDKPIGYLAATEKKFGYRTNKVVEIENMGVAPDYRSKGIGSKLVEQFRVWAKKQGFTHIFVSSFIKNKKAVKFYQNQDLKPIDISLEGEV